MKKIIYTLFLNLVLIATVYGQAGTISFHENMYAVTSKTWNIDIKEAKAVRITYAIDIGLSDALVFFDLSSSGAISSGGFPVYGYRTGTYITTTQTGKAQITIYNSSLSVIKNIDIQYCADNSIETKNDLNVGGNATITGNTILKGTIRGNQAAGALQVKTDYGYVNIGPLNGYVWAHIATDLPKFIFNKPICAQTGEFSAYDVTNLALQTASTTRMTILSSNGNVGIGALIPAQALDVERNADYQLRLGNTGGQGYNIGRNGTTGSLTFYGDQSGANGYTFGGVNGTRMIIDKIGNVGIGTTSPSWKFVVSKNGAAGLEIDPDLGTAGKIGVYAYNRSTSSLLPILFQASQYEFNGGNVGIGTTTATPGTKLDVNGIINTNADIQLGSGQGNSYLKLNTNSRSWWAGVGVTSDDNRFVIYDQTSNRHALTIGTDGNVGIGIGTAQAICKLEVNGTIHAKEVLVDINAPLADFVFNKSYKLMPLNQVEQYVNTTSHLPEMPSASEVKEKGMNMGEMQNKLLQKVEELTLYVIEQQKTINQQSAKIEELEKKIK